jgi:hypothetical protein
MEWNKNQLQELQYVSPYNSWPIYDIREHIHVYRSEERQKARRDAGLSLNNGHAICSLPQAQGILRALHLYLIIGPILQLGQKPHELFNIPACLSERDPPSLSRKLLDKSNYLYDVTTTYMFQ